MGENVNFLMQSESTLRLSGANLWWIKPLFRFKSYIEIQCFIDIVWYSITKDKEMNHLLPKSLFNSSEFIALNVVIVASNETFLVPGGFASHQLKTLNDEDINSNI